MDSEHQDKDINDVFDELLLSEEHIGRRSYTNGFEEGLARGNFEAFHMGYHRGAEISAELGYYLGIVETLLVTKEPVHSSEKSFHNLQTLKDLIHKYPNDNSESIDLITELENIRSLYKKTCAILKINAPYIKPLNLSF